MKIIEKSLITSLILSIILILSNFSSNCQGINKKILRLHVIANSDSKEDQELKLKVRDKILEYSRDKFSSGQSKEEIQEFIFYNLNEIKNIAQKEVYNLNYNYQVNAEIKNMHFNTREYKNFTLPAGSYDALRITIGEGKGKNWWCVMFPVVCLPAAEENYNMKDFLNPSEIDIIESEEQYEIKFKVVELLEDFKNFISS